MLVRKGLVSISSAISPYLEIRDEIRQSHHRFFEVYMKCSIEKLSERDVKGLYKKALAGEIKNFTGVSDPYEEPLNPELILDSGSEKVEQSLQKLLRTLEVANYIGNGVIR